MILNIHSDASYLSEKEAKNQTGGLFYIGSNTDKANKLTSGAILIIRTVLKTHHVLSSDRNRNWCSNPKCKIRNSPLYHTRRTGTSSAPNTCGN
jgi:hypothetical protein